MRIVPAVVASLFLVALLSGCTAPAPPPCDPCDVVSPSQGPGDVVVVAVVDSGFNPYHHDFLANFMPQALDDDASNDLPLDQDPVTWLPGHPGAGAFASYEPLAISMPESHDAVPQELHDNDHEAWDAVAVSDATEVHMRWLPGTKVVGFVDFQGNGGFAPASHGVGTTSVSVGNLYGSCPECLLVFVNGPSEVANRWVESQDWIDVQTNSWGFSSLPGFCTPTPPTQPPAPAPGVPTKCGVRDRVYAGSDTEAQRAAVERGQAIFFSAGNGLFNDFSAPNPTLFSSQEGPDWIITVGAVSPNDQSAYSGAGKPVDIAGIGRSYPSAGGRNVTDTKLFGGTSNATPVLAGLYARALHEVRREWAGHSRIQEGGVVAQEQVECEDAAGACLPGRHLHFTTLREALFAAADRGHGNWNVSDKGTAPATTKEAAFTALGHGILTGRLFGHEELDNQTERISHYARGKVPLPMPDVDETEWFAADSYCRQGVWGAWSHGAYVEGNTTLPTPHPEWPTRSFYTTSCPTTIGAVVQASRALPE